MCVCVCVCVCRYRTLTSSVINRLNISGHLLLLELQIGEIFLLSVEKQWFSKQPYRCSSVDIDDTGKS